LRTGGIIAFEQIREVRTHLTNPEGYKDVEDFIERQEIEKDIADYYSKTRRPAHTQPIEIWFEKETIAEDFESVCSEYDIPTLPIRGKPQWSTIKKAADRLTDKHKILYFGDNDKIGRQIYRTIMDYVFYLRCNCSFEWCGLTDVQETKYGLPGNARLDGLDAKDLEEMVRKEVLKYIDKDKLKEIETQEDKDKEELKEYKLKIIKR